MLIFINAGDSRHATVLDKFAGGNYCHSTLSIGRKAHDALLPRKIMKRILLAAVVAALAGCVQDDNVTPTYGKVTGLPVNCRAYVQVVIDGYRSGKYSADESFSGLERNCGANGMAWKDRR